MNQLAIMESKIEVLCKQVDDLKCCGNCKHYTPRGDCRSKHEYQPGHYCDYWLPDGLKREDREYLHGRAAWMDTLERNGRNP